MQPASYFVRHIPTLTQHFPNYTTQTSSIPTSTTNMAYSSDSSSSNGSYPFSTHPPNFPRNNFNYPQPRKTTLLRRLRRAGYDISQMSVVKPPLRPLIQQIPELIPYLKPHTNPPPKKLTTQAAPTPNITSETQTTPSEAEPERASLLGLPGEIRNQIYAYVVVREEPIEIEYTTQHVGDGLSLQRFTPAMVQPLIMVSRKLRHEVQSLLVRENHFKITDCSRFFEPKSMKALSSFRGFCEGFGAELRRIRVRL